MSPVARSQGHAGRALLVAVVGIAVGIVGVVGLAVLANRGSVEVRLGDDTFEAGDVERLAEEIADRGPVIYSDVAGGDRDIVVQHLGDDTRTGWYAFEVRPAGAPRDCVVEWQPADEVFLVPCTDDEIPATGEGLPKYPVRIEDGKVDVDLNAADRATSTTR